MLSGKTDNVIAETESNKKCIFRVENLQTASFEKVNQNTEDNRNLNPRPNMDRDLAITGLSDEAVADQMSTLENNSEGFERFFLSFAN